MDPDTAVRDAAARAWCDWESAYVATTGALARRNPRYDDPLFRLGFARRPLDCAWLLNQAWPASKFVIVDDEGHTGISMFAHRTRALAEFATT